MAQICALGIKELLVDRVIEREVVLFDGLPKLCRVLFAQKHDGLAGATEIVRLEVVN